MQQRTYTKSIFASSPDFSIPIRGLLARSPDSNYLRWYSATSSRNDHVLDLPCLFSMTLQLIPTIRYVQISCHLRLTACILLESLWKTYRPSTRSNLLCPGLLPPGECAAPLPREQTANRRRTTHSLPHDFGSRTGGFMIAGLLLLGSPKPFGCTL